MPILHLTVRFTGQKVDPQNLEVYARHFEKMAKDPKLTTFKNGLEETAKCLRQQAKLKRENPFY